MKLVACKVQSTCTLMAMYDAVLERCVRFVTMCWPAGEVTIEGVFKVSGRHGCGARGAAAAEDGEAVHWQPNILFK